MDGDKARDKVLTRMLKTPPKPKATANKFPTARGEIPPGNTTTREDVRADTRGAAKGLSLDNMEDMASGLRAASEPTRTARQAINSESIKKAVANRSKAKKAK